MGSLDVRTSEDVAFRVSGVSKVFVTADEPVTAVDDVSLDIRAGSFTCIVGPSGCGKSTLLRMLGGLESPTAGTIQSFARSSAVPPSAFVFQEHGVFPWLTVVDNVAFGLHMAGVPKSERIAVSHEWLKKVGISQFSEAYPDQLSGGMRQRVAIARAFATGSPFLLMDEPLGALDAQTRRLMQELLIRLWEEERKTVVLVTHAIEEALLLGDRLLTMTARPGRIKSDQEIPFPYPRSLQLEKQPEFAEMKDDIWESLRAEVNASLTEK